ncbi:acyltransferase [Oxalobacter sp. OttesenSCG-928-P03]|nr:acyltransferase [Oxalobacter sp. OttesenSCG-928-P03]
MNEHATGAGAPLPQAEHQSYRPDIDGLRAFAILSVVIFHASPSSLRGGFVGVDVFFVISGFLISGIIFRGLDRGTFSFSDFYIRRIRRIFPALLLILAVSMLAGWYWLLANDFTMLGKHMASSLSFIQNLILYGEAGYFDTASEYKPLMHLWSLAVEEQFYLLFPLLMWLLWRIRANIPVTVTIIALFSFWQNLSLVRADETAAFFLPQARFWEIMAGSLLAWGMLFPQRIPFLGKHFVARENGAGSHLAGLGDIREKRVRNILSAAGMVFLLFSVIVIRQSRPFPGTWALLPVLGSVLVILAGPEAWLNRRIFGSRIAVWIGLISYPLYLWHWPVFSFIRILEYGKPSWQWRTCGAVLSFVLAWLTWRLIERPIRFGGRRLLKTALLCMVAVVLGIVGWNIYKGHIDPKSKQYGVDDIISAIIEWDDPKALSPMQIDGVKLNGIEGEKLTLFYGDSNMEQYTARIVELLKDSDGKRGAAFLAKGGCVPIPGVKRKTRPQCDVMAEHFFTLAKNERVDTIVVAASWVEYYLSGTRATIEGVPLESEAGISRSIEAIDRMLGNIAALDKKAYLVLNIPLGLEAQSLVKRDILRGEFQVRSRSIDKEAFRKKHEFIQNPMKDLAEKHGITVIDPVDHLCGKETCPALSPEGKAMYKDGDHLRSTYVRDHVKYLDETVTAGPTGKKSAKNHSK